MLYIGDSSPDLGPRFSLSNPKMVLYTVPDVRLLLSNHHAAPTAPSNAIALAKAIPITAPVERAALVLDLDQYDAVVGETPGTDVIEDAIGTAATGYIGGGFGTVRMNESTVIWLGDPNLGSTRFVIVRV